VTAGAAPSPDRDRRFERSPYEQLIAYYEEAGPDFGQWSAGFNMHFGFYRFGMNPLRREPMLNELNEQVVSRLRLPLTASGLIVDLGCGVGATVRYAAERFRASEVCGVTVVPWQVETGNAWNRRIGMHPRARLELRDYTNTGFADGCSMGAYAIESACHAPGSCKEPFIAEAGRILKRGARLVVADGFLKNPHRTLGRTFERLHDALCRSFVLPRLAQIEEFVATLPRYGFTDVTVEDISWRIAPSALHAPAAVLWFALKKRIRGEGLAEWSVNNLRGSVLSAVLGANRLKFGYYIVSATKT
jgi:MPBQ/MSBQ methyltransferase